MIAGIRGSGLSGVEPVCAAVVKASAESRATQRTRGSAFRQIMMLRMVAAGVGMAHENIGIGAVETFRIAA